MKNTWAPGAQDPSSQTLCKEFGSHQLSQTPQCLWIPLYSSTHSVRPPAPVIRPGAETALGSNAVLRGTHPSQNGRVKCACAGAKPGTFRNHSRPRAAAPASDVEC